MFEGKKLFAASILINKIYDLIPHDKVHIFWKKLNGDVLGCNEMQSVMFGVSKSSEMTGLNFFKLSPISEHALIKQNDKIVYKEDRFLLVSEFVFGNTGLGIKLPLKDSANHIEGVFGLSFFFHQTNFGDIINTLNSVFKVFSLEPQARKNYILSSLSQRNELSLREKQCVIQLVDGKTDKEIACRLGISFRTVEKHIGNIKAKLHCSNRAQIILKLLGENVQIQHSICL